MNHMRLDPDGVWRNRRVYRHLSMLRLYREIEEARACMLDSLLTGEEQRAFRIKLSWLKAELNQRIG